MPAVHTRYFSDPVRSCVLMFDDEPFAVCQEQKTGWAIYDVRQFNEVSQTFVGKPAAGYGNSCEHAVRIACAHIG